MLVQAGLCLTCSEITLLVFPRGGSFTFIGYYHLLEYIQEEHKMISVVHTISIALAVSIIKSGRKCILIIAETKTFKTC